jgi:hypothetical protein
LQWVYTVGLKAVFRAWKMVEGDRKTFNQAIAFFEDADLVDKSR